MNAWLNAEKGGALADGNFYDAKQILNLPVHRFKNRHFAVNSEKQNNYA